MEQAKTLPLRQRYKYPLLFLAIATLICVYIFQRFNYCHFFFGILGIDQTPHPYTTFIVNRTVRLMLNDTACLILIWVWFKEKKYLRLAGYVFIFELMIVLPLYFIVKLSLEGDSEISSPLLSQIHRMIVNPMLMFLLMVAFLYQRKKESSVS
jgi:exosortase F-associated protein